MKTTVIKLEGVESVLSTGGVEKRMCTHAGIHKVETNFMTGTATVYHDESVSLEEIKRCVAECGYTCTGECLPEHLVKPGGPPAIIATKDHSMHGDHAGRTMPAASSETTHGAHDMSAHAGHAMPEARPVAKGEAH